MPWRCPACEPEQHAVGRPFHRAAADQRAHGDARHAPLLERFAQLPHREDRPDRDVRVARRDQDQVYLRERPRAPQEPAARSPPPRNARRRPRPGDRGRRTTPGTGTCPPESRATSATGRRSPAGVVPPRRGPPRAGRSPQRAAPRPVATGSGRDADRGRDRRARTSPRRRAPRPSRAPATSRRCGPSRVVRRRGRRARRGSSRGRARRAAPRISTSSPTLPMTLVAAGTDHVDDAADEARAPDTSREDRDVQATLLSSSSRHACVRGPARIWSRVRSVHRVHVVGEVGNGDGDGLQAQRRGVRAEAVRAALTVERREASRSRKAERRSSFRRGPRRARRRPPASQREASGDRAARRTGHPR